MKEVCKQSKWIKNVIGAIVVGLFVLTTGILPVKAATFTCPTFSITDTEGNAVTNESIKGKATVLIFTTNWCTNGTSTLGQLGNANWYPCPNVNVVVGMLGADKQATTEFHNTYDFEGMRFCYTETTNDMTTLAFNMFHRAGGEGSEVSTPLIFIIDSNGTVQYESEGRKTAAQLADILDDYVSLSYPIEGCLVDIENVECTYTGEAKTPGIGVKCSNGRYLTKGVDYRLSYENNINAGTAYAVVTGTGYAKGTIKVPFTIQPASIDNAIIGYIPEQNYTETAIMPNAMTVELKGKKLQANTDYTVSYENNIEPGTATAIITGKGNYIGTVRKSFVIKCHLSKSKIDDLEFTYTTGNLKKLNSKTFYSLYMDFRPVKYATTYEIELSDEKGKAIKTYTVECGKKDFIEKSIKKLPKDVYGVRIRGCRDGEYGEWSDRSFVVKQPKAQARNYKGAIQIKWQKLKGVSRYDIYLSKKQNSGYKKVASANAKTTLKTIKKLGKKKLKKGTYYYYVVAKKKVGKKTYKSKISYKLNIKKK